MLSGDRIGLCGHFLRYDSTIMMYNSGLIVLDSIGNLTNTIQLPSTPSDQLFLYPSLTSGVIYLSGFENDDKNLFYTVFNTIGQEIAVDRIQVHGTKISLAFSSIPNGHYVLSIKNLNGKSYLPKKFVKMN
jgi:hypothetical protein